ncbi:MAG: signal peptidase II [bacterium]|nr:signal peptidase II [bacterium]
MYTPYRGAPSIIVLAALFGVDRITKWIALSHFNDGSVFIPGILEFSLSWNPAILFFFSFSQWWQERLFFILLLFFLGWFLSTVFDSTRLRRGQLLLFQGLIAIGALSNTFDRFSYGAVIDWVHIISLTSFNLADAYVLTGIFGSAWITMRK